MNCSFLLRNFCHFMELSIFIKTNTSRLQKVHEKYVLWKNDNELIVGWAETVHQLSCSSLEKKFKNQWVDSKNFLTSKYTYNCVSMNFLKSSHIFYNSYQFYNESWQRIRRDWFLRFIIHDLDPLLIHFITSFLSLAQWLA